MPQSETYLPELAPSRFRRNVCWYNLSYGVSHLSFEKIARIADHRRELTVSLEVSSTLSFQLHSAQCSVSCNSMLLARTLSSPISSSTSITLTQARDRSLIESDRYRISVAALISFAARGLSTTEYFCYESVASAGVVMVLPGYVVRKYTPTTLLASQTANLVESFQSVDLSNSLRRT